MKIRMDFVTNSSSSSFICFGMFNEELVAYVRELLDAGHAVDGPHNEYWFGEEACSAMFFREDGVYTHHQLFGIYDPMGSFNIKWADEDYCESNEDADEIASEGYDPDDPEDMEEYRHEHGCYTGRDRLEDKETALSYLDNIVDSVALFFMGLSDEEWDKLFELAENALENGEVSCRVFIAETDSCDYDNHVYDIARDVKEKKGKSNKQSDEDEKLSPAEEQTQEEKWLGKYGRYIETNPAITIDGKKFVFSGLGGNLVGKDDPIIQKVIEKGGQYRKSVSGLTDYLVVNPADAGQSKIVAAIGQQQKGKGIKIIFLKDLEKALQSAKPPAVKPKPAIPKSTKPQLPKDFTIKNGALTKYKGKGGDVIIPDGVKEIGWSAFKGCNKLTSVTIPDGVIKIDICAFVGCKNLISIIIPDSVTKIGNYAFFGCTSLTSITISNNIYAIGAGAFKDCDKLTSVTILDSVTEIGDDAFEDCPNLTIHAPAGSKAEEFAKKQGIPFEAI